MTPTRSTAFGPACSAIVRAAAALALGAGAAAAQAEPDPGRAAAFVAVVQQQGCAITEAQAADLLPPVGLTMEDAYAAVALLNRGPLFSVDDDGVTLRLVPELCAADAARTAELMAEMAARPEPELELESLTDRIDPDQAVALIGALRAEGCAMSEERAAEVLPGMGLDPFATRDIAALLIETGRAAFDDTGLALAPELCAADPAGDEAAVVAALIEFETGAMPSEGLLPDDLRDALALMALTGGDCTVATGDPALLVQTTLEMFGLVDEPGDWRAQLEALLPEVLAEPGPELAAEEGRLRLIDCSPEGAADGAPRTSP